MDFKHRYGAYAIVTGASAGLGEAFAQELAARGLNLVLVARRQSKIEALAAQLSAAHGVAVKTVALDLARADAAEILARDTAELDVGLVVLNAAQAVMGHFLDNDVDKECEVLRVNVQIPLRLAHHFGNRLRRRGRGGLLFVSSLIAFGAGALQANYAGTKAHVSAFAQSLRAELVGSGVDVTIVAPGGMKTEGIENLGLDVSRMPTMEPRVVARIGLDAVGKKALVVPGAMNAFGAWVMKYVLPQAVTAKLLGSMTSKMLGNGRNATNRGTP